MSAILIRPFSKLSENRSQVFSNQGFSLIELLVVVTVIGIIAGIAIPSLSKSREVAQVRGVASNLQTFGKGFTTYMVMRGQYPPDWHTGGPYHLPPDMEDFVAADIWVAVTPLGGNYNWEGPDSYPYAGISINGATAPVATMTMLDEMLDDGDLGQGIFRVTPNGRYTYILEE